MHLENIHLSYLVTTTPLTCPMLNFTPRLHWWKANTLQMSQNWKLTVAYSCFGVCVNTTQSWNYRKCWSLLDIWRNYLVFRILQNYLLAVRSSCVFIWKPSDTYAADKDIETEATCYRHDCSSLKCFQLLCGVWDGEYSAADLHRLCTTFAVQGSQWSECFNLCLWTNRCR